MTIYELTQALKRYRVPVIIAFVLLIGGVFFMTFTFDGGKPTFRSGLQYESSVKIAVITPNTDSLLGPEATTADLEGEAELYASLLQSDEASTWIGEQNGFRLEEPVSTVVEGSVISASVLAPTAEQARQAALDTFEWLNKKLLEPVTTADFPSPPTTLATISLTGTFTSFLNVVVSEEVAQDAPGLFLTVEIDGLPAVALPLDEPGGRTVRTSTALKPVMTLVLTLSDENDEVLDQVRLAPPAAPNPVLVLPEMRIDLEEGAVRRSVISEDEVSYTIDTADVTVVWSDGVPPEEIDQTEIIAVDLALLTTQPGFITSGGRRGPILAISALVIGTLLILTSVIVADTWRSQRDAAHDDDRDEDQSDNGARPRANDRSHSASSGSTPPVDAPGDTRKRRRSPARQGTDIEVKTANLE